VGRMCAAIAHLIVAPMTAHHIPDQLTPTDSRDAVTAALGDILTVGDITGSYAAIGAGAQVIVTQVQQALSAVDEMEKGIRVAERRLAEAIQRLINRYPSLIAAEPDNRANPYKSLLDYKLEDAPYFYGREDAIATMREKMRQGRLTILESDSGSGKTSLLQAGLSSRMLAEGDLPLYIRAYNLPPGIAIRQAFLPDYATQTELQRYRDQSMTLRGFLERVTFYLGNREMTIFLDQFEEFFTELPVKDRAKFAAQLRDCIESDLPVRWVLALRKEYLAELRVFEPLKPFNNKYFLPTFKLDEAHEVLTKPALLKGVVYESGLVGRILDDIRDDSDVIPPVQVQLVCYTLFEELSREKDESIISCAQYDRRRGRGEGRPGAAGILSSHLTRVLDNELTGSERKVAGRVLEALGTSDARRGIRDRAGLVKAGGDPAAVERALSVLYENRLVRRAAGDDDEPAYELTHDYLLGEITLDPETRSRKLANEMLQHDGVVWASNQYDKAFLIPQGRLLFIESYLDRAEVPIEALELLEQSNLRAQEQSREEIRRLKAIGNRNLAILGIVSVVALALAVRYLIIPYFMRLSAANGQFTELVSIDRLDDVRFEAYEVTNDRFAKCVDWGVCDLPGAFHLVRPDPADNPLWFTDPKWLAARYKPVVEVDAVNAMRFCEWIGRTLPTAEQVAHVYPPRAEWPKFPADTALLCRGGLCDSPTPVNARTTPQYQNTGRAGIFDLVGSVNEWTRTEITSFESPRQCVDLAGFEEVVSIVILGDDYATYVEEAGISYQNTGEAYSNIDVRFEKFGFRCVEDLQPSYHAYACPDLR
ncbi:MAG TPA: SUMF1/EgtB/PvdO family nonheme iron enzyme, partial [Promineifilum sp.]|nr:SUMF1/EgtB/PvdO family nonheme iron enzyme [Promineifilum sp.]